MKKISDIAIGDTFTFKAADGKHKAIICTSIYKDRSPQHFDFCATAYSDTVSPTIEDIKQSGFFGVGNTTKGQYFKYSEGELAKMWSIHPEIKPYVLGSYGFLILRKALVKFLDNFQFIGNLDVVDNLHLNGNGSVNASDWNFLEEFFNDSLPSVMKYRNQEMFKVEAIIR